MRNLSAYIFLAMALATVMLALRDCAMPQAEANPYMVRMEPRVSDSYTVWEVVQQ